MIFTKYFSTTSRSNSPNDPKESSSVNEAKIKFEEDEDSDLQSPRPLNEGPINPSPDGLNDSQNPSREVTYDDVHRLVEEYSRPVDESEFDRRLAESEARTAAEVGSRQLHIDYHNIDAERHFYVRDQQVARSAEVLNHLPSGEPD